MEIGSLSNRYECVGDPGTISYDSVGGWSYGSYQISTKAGAFQDFMIWLERHNPDIAHSLQVAGGVTGAITGTEQFQACWKSYAKNQKSAFQQAQQDFITASHLDVTLKKLKKAGFDLEYRSNTLLEVLYSLSVATGPGMAKLNGKGCCGLVMDAIASIGSAIHESQDDVLIDAIYTKKIERIDKLQEYSRLDQRMRKSIRNRFSNEHITAITMLGEELSSRSLN